MKHFYEVLTGIDPAPLLAQLAEHPELWSNRTEWTAKKQGSVIYDNEAIVLRYLTLGMETDSDRLYLYEKDRDRSNWNRPAFGILSEARPIVQRLLAAVGEHLGHVIITRLPAGGQIKPHIDQWPVSVPRYWQRHQIPLLGCSRFKCGDEELLMQPGSAYWFDNSQEHSVETDEERISMIVDLRLF